jgi:hypothetical protein
MKLPYQRNHTNQVNLRFRHFSTDPMASPPVDWVVVVVCFLLICHPCKGENMLELFYLSGLFIIYDRLHLINQAPTVRAFLLNRTPNRNHNRILFLYPQQKPLRFHIGGDWNLNYLNYVGKP